MIVLTRKLGLKMTKDVCGLPEQSVEINLMIGNVAVFWPNDMRSLVA